MPSFFRQAFKPRTTWAFASDWPHHVNKHGYCSDLDQLSAGEDVTVRVVDRTFPTRRMGESDEHDEQVQVCSM